MDFGEEIICPNCKSNNLEVKRRVTYVYTYKLNTEENKRNIDTTEALPFLFDNREKSCSDEYLQCINCGGRFPFDLESRERKIDFTILSKAVRSDHTENPEFLG